MRSFRVSAILVANSDPFCGPDDVSRINNLTAELRASQANRVSLEGTIQEQAERISGLQEELRQARNTTTE